MTTFADMVFQLGGAPVGLGASLPFTTGTYYFVDSSTGNDGNAGTKPTSALKTIDAAIGKCTANKGDVIVVMPTHAENLSAATSLVLDVAGVTVVGLGNGNQKPTLTITGTAGKIHVNADAVTIDNIRIVAGIDAIVQAIDVDEDYCVVKNCEIVYSSTYDILKHVDIADGKDGFQFLNNRVIARNAAGSAQAIAIRGSDRVVIGGNFFSGDWSAGIIDDTDTSTTAISEQLLIEKNKFYNSDTALAANSIDLDRTSTGLILDNKIGTLAAGAPIDPGACLCAENYLVNAVDETGLKVPTTASTT